MKIDEIYHRLNLMNGTGETSTPKRPDSADEVASPPGKGEDPRTHVDLSGASVEFNRVAEMMDQESPERIAKLTKIRSAIENGHYNADERKVADKIFLEAVLDFLRP